MAQTTSSIASRTQLLRYDHAMVDELLEVFVEWDELGDSEQTSWMMDWDQFALEDVPRLSNYAATGQLTSDQFSEYKRLLQRIEQHRDLIQRFNLTMPRVPVET